MEKFEHSFGYALNVLHVCWRFYPNRGGSETYVDALIVELSALGVTSSILSFGDSRQSISRDGIDHEIFPISDGVYSSIAQILSSRGIDLVHFHFLPAEYMSLSKNNFNFVFTLHHAQAFCLAGSMVNPIGFCDGVAGLNKCTGCFGVELGAPGHVAQRLAKIPLPLSQACSAWLPRGKVATALGLRGYVDRRLRYIGEFMGAMDSIVVLSRWSLPILDAWDVDLNNCFLSPLGLDRRLKSPERGNRRNENNVSNGVLRAVYVGSVSQAKGIPLLIQALARTRSIFEIDLYGPFSDDFDPKLREFIENSAGPIRYKGIAPDMLVSSIFANYDFSIVPSVSIETGPFTVIESLNAGTPVLAANRGGMLDLIEDKSNGILFDAGDSTSLAGALDWLNRNPDWLKAARQCCHYSRSSQHVANEMLELYLRLRSKGNYGEYGQAH